MLSPTINWYPTSEPILHRYSTKRAPHRYSPINLWGFYPPRRCIFAHHWRMLAIEVFMLKFGSAKYNIIFNKKITDTVSVAICTTTTTAHFLKNRFFICISLLFAVRLPYSEWRASLKFCPKMKLPSIRLRIRWFRISTRWCMGDLLSEPPCVKAKRLTVNFLPTLGILVSQKAKRTFEFL